MAQRPSAAGCCLGGKILSNRVWDRGISGPPNSPCNTRNALRSPMEGASPHRAENRPNPSRATTNARTVPKREAIQPVRGTLTASATA